MVVCVTVYSEVTSNAVLIIWTGHCKGVCGAAAIGEAVKYKHY